FGGGMRGPSGTMKAISGSAYSRREPRPIPDPWVGWTAERPVCGPNLLPAATIRLKLETRYAAYTPEERTTLRARIRLPMVRGLPATRRLSADRKMGSRSRRLVQAKRGGTSGSRRHRGFLGLPIRTSAAEVGPTVLFAQL